MPPKPRKIPLRMCVACREMKPKKDLLRVVVPSLKNAPVADEQQEVIRDAITDRSGKVSGRGAYICASTACLANARKTKAIERALSCRVPEKTWELLLRQTESSIQEEE